MDSRVLVIFPPAEDDVRLCRESPLSLVGPLDKIIAIEIAPRLAEQRTPLD
jgi:hypothetical protein